MAPGPTIFWCSTSAPSTAKSWSSTPLLLMPAGYGRYNHTKKQYPSFWTANYIPIATKLVQECSPPSNYCMGTAGCIFPRPNLTSKAMGTQTRATVYTKYLPLGTARITPHLRPDRAMENVELMQECTQPTRLCECKLVQRGSRNIHARKQSVQCYSKLIEKERSKDRTEVVKAHPQQDPASPNQRTIRVATQPYENIHPPDQVWA